jgi:Zn finger protein HypA/HybF involved in hydrogenase expression
VAPNALLCGKCSAWRVELKSGDELMLKRVELALDAEATTEG